MSETQTKLGRFSGEKGVITIEFTDDDDWMVDGPPGEVSMGIHSSAEESTQCSKLLNGSRIVILTSMRNSKLCIRKSLRR